MRRIRLILSLVLAALVLGGFVALSDLAQALAAQKQWQGKPPLLLLTTATADQLYVGGEQNVMLNLMDIYRGRSFRFCFTNGQMAEAVRDLVWSHPLLRPAGSLVPGV